MAKLADAQVSGSCGRPWGFKSLRPHHTQPYSNRRIRLCFSYFRYFLSLTKRELLTPQFKISSVLSHYIQQKNKTPYIGAINRHDIQSFVVGTAELESATSCMSSKRSNQLSYAPVNNGNMIPKTPHSVKRKRACFLQKSSFFGKKSSPHSTNLYKNIDFTYSI